MEKTIIIKFDNSNIYVENPNDLNPIEIVGLLEITKTKYRVDFIAEKRKLKLDAMEKKLDEVLACETKESLKKWLEIQRKV